MAAYLDDPDGLATPPFFGPDDDGYTPPPFVKPPPRTPRSLGAAAPPPGAGSSHPPGPPTPGAPSGPDYAALEAKIGQRPTLEAPKWWQRGLAGAAGFGAGWSNAAGRTRHPIDINAAQQNIMHPGFAEKQAEFQSQLQPLEDVANVRSQQVSNWYKNRQLEAQAEYERQHGAYFQHRAEMEQNQWKIDPKSGTVYNTVTGERSAPPNDPNTRYETAKKIGSDEETARYYALNGNLAGFGSTLEKSAPPTKPLVIPEGGTMMDPNNPGKVLYKNPRTFKPGEGEAKPPSRAAWQRIETTKSSRLLQAEQQARAAMANPNRDPSVTPEAIQANLGATKQQIQNDYENEIEALGGTAQHLNVNKQAAPAPQAAAPAAHPAAAPQIHKDSIIVNDKDPTHRMQWDGTKWVQLHR